MHRLDQRGFAHAARPPEQHVVGRVASGEAFGIVHENVANPVDAPDQADLDAIDLVHRLQIAGIGLPHEAIGDGKVGLWRGGRRETGNSLDQAVEFRIQGFKCIVGHRVTLRSDWRRMTL
jgi:hypothetical protein